MEGRGRTSEGTSIGGRDQNREGGFGGRSAKIILDARTSLRLILAFYELYDYKGTDENMGTR